MYLELVSRAMKVGSATRYRGSLKMVIFQVSGYYCISILGAPK